MKKYYYQPGGVIGSIRLSILIILIAIAYSAQLDTTSINYVTPILLVIAVVYAFVMYKRTYITFEDKKMNIYGVSKSTTYELTESDINEVTKNNFVIKIQTNKSSIQTSITLIGTKSIINNIFEQINTQVKGN